MKQVCFYLTGMLLFLVFGCTNNNQTTKGTDNVTTAGQQKSVESKPATRYGIKSGTLVYSAPMDMKQTLYFDEFGNREVLISEMQMAGMNFKDTEIRKDGYVYKFKTGEKTGTKMKWNVQDQNYDKMDPEMLKQYKLKDLGSEEVAGRKCRKYSVEVGRTPVYAWIYEGLAMKTVTQMMGKDFVIEAIKFDEGPVPAGLFEIPSDITFTELN